MATEQGDGGRLTEKEYWAGFFGSAPDADAIGDVPYFEKQLSTLLPADPQMTFLEIGCFPGPFMVFFHKRFGYKVAGLDFIERLNDMGPWLKRRGVEEFELFHADLFEFPTDRKFDVVGSFGFVEHFEDTRAVIRKHADLTSPGGYVVVSIPNLRYGQKLLCRIFAPDVRRTHNMKLDKKTLERELRLAGLEISYSSYAGTFRVYMQGSVYGLWRLPKRVVRRLDHEFRRLLRLMRLDNVPNRFFSPHILAVARKPR